MVKEAKSPRLPELPTCDVLLGVKRLPFRAACCICTIRVGLLPLPPQDEQGERLGLLVAGRRGVAGDEIKGDYPGYGYRACWNSRKGGGAVVVVGEGEPLREGSVGQTPNIFGSNGSRGWSKARVVGTATPGDFIGHGWRILLTQRLISVRWEE
jgi:hypothetical protein